MADRDIVNFSARSKDAERIKELFARNYCLQHNRAFSRLNTVTGGELSRDTPTRLVNIKVQVDTDAAVSQSPERDVFLRFIRACIVHSTIINTEEIDIDLFGKAGPVRDRHRSVKIDRYSDL